MLKNPGRGNRVVRTLQMMSEPSHGFVRRRCTQTCERSAIGHVAPEKHMCYTVRSCRCGHPVVTGRVGCMPIPGRRFDPTSTVCPGVYAFQARRPPLEQLCPVCEGKSKSKSKSEDGHGGDGRGSCDKKGDRDETEHQDEHHDWEEDEQASTGVPRARAEAYRELTGYNDDDEADGDREDAHALQRQDSHGSTYLDNVPPLSRTSRSTWTSSTAMSLRSSADFAAAACAPDDDDDDDDVADDPGIRIVSAWTGASQQDLTSIDPMTTPLAAYPNLSPRVEYHHDTHRPLTSPSLASSFSTAALPSDHRHRFTKKLWGWRQSDGSQHRRNKSEPKDMRLEKKTRNRWKAIVSRNRSFDSDKSFVCMTAREIQNQGQSEGDPRFRGG
ncbi:hypothetical protein E4U43_000207 [Claviceps pusilla]|uniref:Uncharacterized protein n=1 Tax=Claviceps pusilla TaxID=123648 RepID=A0A9P7NCC7_9HYPO|nr:hypothetical protein E4U43_000207 [Claviceps pusilla]